jgi:hypothetical protein
VASNYPGSLDSFDTIASDKKTSDSVGGRTHRDMHNDLGDAIEAVQAELGTTPSGSYATVKARFEAIEGSTLPQVDAKGDLIVGTADNTYDNLTAGTNDTVLVADSAQSKGVKWAQVPTAGIADSAVTSAKIADDTIVNADINASAAIAASKISGTALVASTADAKGDLYVATAADTVARLAVGADGAVLMADSAQSAGVKWAAAPYVNLLGADQSAFETGTTGWGTSNVTVTRTTASYKSGSASMRVASSTDTSTTKRARTSTRPAVTAGKTYTICASLKGDGTTSYRLTVLWYNAASSGSIVGTVNGNYTTASAGWFDERMELVAPVGATHCEINVYVDNATLTGGYVDVDEVAIWEGIGGTWSQGGTQITGTTGVAFTKTLYVDTATGAAANPGTAALPVAKTVPGGHSGRRYRVHDQGEVDSCRTSTRNRCRVAAGDVAVGDHRVWLCGAPLVLLGKYPCDVGLDVCGWRGVLEVAVGEHQRRVCHVAVRNHRRPDLHQDTDEEHGHPHDPRRRGVRLVVERAVREVAVECGPRQPHRSNPERHVQHPVVLPYGDDPRRPHPVLELDRCRC